MKIILSLLLLTIIGFIPMILVILAEKSILFTVLLGITVLIILKKMLCD